MTHHLRSQLNAHQGPTAFLGVQGRNGIPSNELAHAEAKTVATAINESPISYAYARSLIRRTPTVPPQANSRTAEVYSDVYWSKDCKAVTNLF